MKLTIHLPPYPLQISRPEAGLIGEIEEVEIEYQPVRNVENIHGGYVLKLFKLLRNWKYLYDLPEISTRGTEKQLAQHRLTMAERTLASQRSPCSNARNPRTCTFSTKGI